MLKESINTYYQAYKPKSFDPSNPYKYPPDIENCAATIKKYDPSFKTRVDVIMDRAAASKGGCYVATAVYGSYDCPQVWVLRRYRDYTLAETWYGRLFIRTYYALSPRLVAWFGDTAWFKKAGRSKLDRMVSNLKTKGVADTPYQDRNW